MTVAADAREAVRAHPFLLSALRAGVVNYRAAADFLDVDGERDAVATALRRFADELPAYRAEDRRATVTMQRGLGLASDHEGALLRVGDAGLVPDAGSLTAIVASGEVDPAALSGVLSRLDAVDVTVETAGVTDGTLVVAVPRRRGARALQAVEDALDAVVA